jgi:hypothetical protein
MINDVISYLPLWAFSVCCLGWLYSGLACFWPRLFHKEIISHAFPSEDGYQFGRAIFWRLSKRLAAWIAVGSLLSLLGLLLPPLPARILLVVVTIALASLWLSHAPGQRFGIVEMPANLQAPVLMLKPAHHILRALILLLFCGILPATFLGAILTLVFRRLSGS